MSRQAVKPGTNLIVRMLNFHSLEMRRDAECVRTTSLAEVRWVKEIIDADGLSFVTGVRYLYTDCSVGGATNG